MKRNSWIGLILLPLFLFGCQIQVEEKPTVEAEMDHATHMETIAAKGEMVMPFDLALTTHYFLTTENGGMQLVLAKDAEDTEQVELIQTHLTEEALRFQSGDFADPIHIHGVDMAGVAELQAGYADIQIIYTPLKNGAEIEYRTTKPELRAAIQAWFGAQLEDHGMDATDVAPWSDFSSEQLVEGEALYIKNCAHCHRVDLEGEPNWQQPNPDGSFRAPPHDETGHTWHHADQLLRDILIAGGERLPPTMFGPASPMPSFAATLTMEEIDLILDYIKSDWPADVQRMQWLATMRVN